MDSAWFPGLEAVWTRIRDEDWTPEYSLLYIQVFLSLTVLQSCCRVFTAVHNPPVDPPPLTQHPMFQLHYSFVPAFFHSVNLFVPQPLQTIWFILSLSLFLTDGLSVHSFLHPFIIHSFIHHLFFACWPLSCHSLLACVVPAPLAWVTLLQLNCQSIGICIDSADCSNKSLYTFKRYTGAASFLINSPSIPVLDYPPVIVLHCLAPFVLKLFRRPLTGNFPLRSFSWPCAVDLFLACRSLLY